MKRTSGYSLVEMLLVLALMSILLALSLVLRPGANRGDSKACAAVVVSELGNARQRALSSGHPVAVAFPSSSGVNSICDGYYVLDGPLHPDISRVRSWAGDYPNTYLFTGDSGATAATGLPPDLTTADWDAPEPLDPTIIFLPTGKVATNLPYTVSGFHLVACTGAVVSGTSLNQASRPYTITVTPAGGISLKKGVPESSSASLLSNPNVLNAAPLPVVSIGTNSAPRDLLVDFFPKANPATLPPGVDATVKWDGYLTLVTTCSDDQADQLLCTWTCDGGNFATTNEIEMEWDAENKQWKGVWVWAPPPGASPADIFTLTCQVRDGRGGVANGQLGATGRAVLLPRGRLVFASDWDGDEDIYVVNADGTDLTKLTKNREKDVKPCWFPDGTKIAYVSNQNRTGTQNEPAGAESIFVMNSDGSQPYKLFNSMNYGIEQITAISISPGGNQIAFMGTASGAWTTDLYLVNADGTHPDNPGVEGPKNLSLSAWAGSGLRGVTWVPDGRYLVFGGGPGLPPKGLAEDLWEYAIDTGTLRNLTNSPGILDHSPSVSPNGTELVYTRNNGGNAGGQLANYTPGGALTGVQTYGWSPGQRPYFAPDGNQVLVRDATTLDLVIMNKDGSAPRVVVPSTAAGAGTPQDQSWIVY